jgi:hypothetical protein
LFFFKKKQQPNQPKIRASSGSLFSLHPPASLTPVRTHLPFPMNLNATTVEGITMGVTAFIMIAPILLLGCVFLIPMCPNIEDCNTYWGQFPFAFLYWLCIPVAFFVITMAVVLAESREYFSENFEEYRCKPWFMPFVSYVRGDVSVQENFDECTAGASQVAYSLMATPLLNASAGLGNGLNVANDTLGKIHRDQVNMASDVSQSFERTYAEADKYTQMSTYFMLKLKAMFDKVVAMVFDVYYALASMMDMLNVAMKGPDIMMGTFLFVIVVVGLMYATFLIISIIVNYEAIFHLIQWAWQQGVWALLALAWANLTVSSIKAGIAAAFMNLHFVFLALYTTMATIYGIMSLTRDRACKAYFQQNTLHTRCAVCFAPATPILTATGAPTPIHALRPGDTLYGGVTVLGTLYVRTPPGTTDWYAMWATASSEPSAPSAPILVTGEHQWWDADAHRWTTVAALHAGGTHAHVVTKVDPKDAPRERWCLVTDAHVLPTPGGWFADYQETSDPGQLGADAARVLRALNGETAPAFVDIAHERGEKVGGLSAAHTWVSTGTADDAWVRLADVRVDDVLEGGAVVTGVYEGVAAAADEAVGHPIAALPLDHIVWDPTHARWAKAYALDVAGTVLPTLPEGVRVGATRHLVTDTGEFRARWTGAADGRVWRLRDFVEGPRVA